MSYFGLFSTEHFLSIGGYILFYLFILFISQFFSKKGFAVVISCAVLIMKIAELVIRNGVYGESIQQLIPIHLCNITLMLCIITMIFPSKSLFQIIYYWSIGAVAAILFPDGRVAFPNFVGISFFATHFFILFTVVYQMISLGYRPTFKGFIGSFVCINIFAGIVYKINEILGTNYMYINYKPTFSSPLDFFGPWPHYIIIVEIIYIVLGLLLYFPFKKRHFKYTNVY
ncbi:TIGR02206 family membrane protein [Fusobacterium sp.]|uniref:YwaF family protein n=1 Tax=Fusobacterium sp. TaxID=68766 RepID=UPI0026220DBE|nr:TIGR02206 family membrane protein [Fusobacterium sp.]